MRQSKVLEQEQDLNSYQWLLSHYTDTSQDKSIQNGNSYIANKMINASNYWFLPSDS